MGELFRTTPIWVLGLLLFVATVACAFAGARFSSWYASRGEALTEAQEGYVVTSVYALLALLVAFTFNVAVERYQGRRQLVVQEANAIETLYLKAQLLDQPHRSTLQNLLVRLGDNHLSLAQLRHGNAGAEKLLAEDDALLRGIWRASGPAFESIRTTDFSTSFIDSVAHVMEVDAERKAARRSQIPTTIIVMLIIYSLVAAAVLGAVMKTGKGRQISVVLLALNVLALMMVTDLNRPVQGTIHESQEPMQSMLLRIKGEPAYLRQPQ